MYLIVGPGGSGQTYFMEFLSKQGISTNASNDCDRQKHLSSPSGIDKGRAYKGCIFLFGHPYYTMMSHIRRSWSWLQCLKLGNPFSITKEVSSNLVALKAKTIMEGRDVFGIEHQFTQWSGATLDCPLLFLDFADILSSQDALNAFFEKTLDYSGFVVQERSSYTVDPDLFPIYEELYQRMRNNLSDK
jgi:hypothetical protein